MEIASPDRRVIVWLCTLLGISFGVVLFSVRYPIAFAGMDFTAFWCGGHTLLARANPYLNQPLHACEAAHFPQFFLKNRNVTIPAPLPPYGLLLLSALSLIPFNIAFVLWLVVLTAAAIFVGCGISKVAKMPLPTAIAASSVAVLGPAIFPGALAPIPVAITVYGALALQSRRWNRTAVLLGLAMVEPHMVLPACIAVFLFIPAMRWRLAAAGAVLNVMMLLAVGPQIAFAYFSVILPIHALAEVNNLAQYSLTAVLYHLGVVPAIAVKAGSLQYFAFVAFSVAVAGRLYRQRGNGAWLVLVPCAFAVIGGAFIHLDQVAMVIPMACLLVVERPSKIGFGALIGLAAPGEVLINWFPFCVPGALSWAWLLSQTRANWKVVVGMSAGLIAAAYWLPVALLSGAHYIPAVIHVRDPGPAASASVAWGQFMSYASVRPSIWWTEKMMTLVPALVILILTVRAAFPARSSAALSASAAGAAAAS